MYVVLGDLFRFHAGPDPGCRDAIAWRGGQYDAAPCTPHLWKTYTNPEKQLSDAMVNPEAFQRDEVNCS